MKTRVHLLLAGAWLIPTVLLVGVAGGVLAFSERNLAVLLLLALAIAATLDVIPILTGWWITRIVAILVLVIGGWVMAFLITPGLNNWFDLGAGLSLGLEREAAVFILPNSNHLDVPAAFVLLPLVAGSPVITIPLYAILFLLERALGHP